MRKIGQSRWGGEDFPEFNPNTVLDWQEVTRGITEVPLLLGMRRPAVPTWTDPVGGRC